LTIEEKQRYVLPWLWAQPSWDLGRRKAIWVSKGKLLFPHWL